MLFWAFFFKKAFSAPKEGCVAETFFADPHNPQIDSDADSLQGKVWVGHNGPR